MTSMAQLRRTFGVPAERHVRVVHCGRPGRILTCNQRADRLLVAFDDADEPEWIHPADRIEYLGKPPPAVE